MKTADIKEISGMYKLTEEFENRVKNNSNTKIQKEFGFVVVEILESIIRDFEDFLTEEELRK